MKREKKYFILKTYKKKISLPYQFINTALFTLDHISNQSNQLRMCAFFTLICQIIDGRVIAMICRTTVKIDPNISYTQEVDNHYLFTSSLLPHLLTLFSVIVVCI